MTTLYTSSKISWTFEKYTFQSSQLDSCYDSMKYSPISMKILYMKNVFVINKHFLVFLSNMKKMVYTGKKENLD